MAEPTEKLLACPFCGDLSPSLHLPTCRPETPYDPTDRLYPWVSCRSCHAEVPGENNDYKGRTAVAAWNRRWPLRAEAYERCAKVCDAIAAEHLKEAGAALERGEVRLGHTQITAARCAAEIRELKYQP